MAVGEDHAEGFAVQRVDLTRRDGTDGGRTRGTKHQRQLSETAPCMQFCDLAAVHNDDEFSVLYNVEVVAVVPLFDQIVPRIHLVRFTLG